MKNNKIIQILADGQSHHITELASAIGYQPQQLNALWQQTPAHIRGLLRQKDGFWRLVRPLALLPEKLKNDFFNIHILTHTTSTNDELLQRARDDLPIHRQVIVAYEQSSGRGRQGKIWQHRLGECLMFSVGWSFIQEQAELGALALVVALSCQRSLQTLGCNTQIKWPNDLVIGLDKLGGILIESIRQNSQTHAIIGIGINFIVPKDLPNTTSLQAAFSHKIAASQLLNQILNTLYDDLNLFAQKGFAPFQADYQAVHRDNGQEICVLHNNQIIEIGTISSIGHDGTLILQTPAGEKHITSGETSLRRPEQLSINTHMTPPSSQYLLLDGGNSRLKWAWVKQGKIIHTNHAPYRDLHILKQEWQEMGHETIRIFGSAVCSTAKQEMVAQQLPANVSIQWLSSMKRALGIYNHYQNIQQHGADRWFNALGSRRFSENACVIISCGTAVTIDALTADNHYLGGTIMPGFHLMKESLALKTANLNQPIGKLFPFPTTTANALAGGMMDAICGSLILMHNRLKSRVGNNMPVDVIMTGGGASKVAKSLPETFVLDNNVKIVDNLVIFGLLNWLESESET